MEQEPPLHHQAGELASNSAISDSEKPMEIDSKDHKKCAHIPNNVSIKENSSSCGSVDPSVLFIHGKKMIEGNNIPAITKPEELPGMLSNL